MRVNRGEGCLNGYVENVDIKALEAHVADGTDTRLGDIQSYLNRAKQCDGQIPMTYHYVGL